MAKMRDFNIFWFFWTLFTVCLTTLVLLGLNRYDNTVYQDINIDLEKRLSQCKFENEQILDWDKEIKRSLEQLIENSRDCYRTFFRDESGSERDSKKDKPISKK